MSDREPPALDERGHFPGHRAEARWQREKAEQSDMLARLRDFARYCAENFDHDDDAHRYNTMCRVCAARRVLGLPPEAP